MRCLVVHGYEIHRHGSETTEVRCGVLTKSVCRTVAKLASQYETIILLGGWHYQNVGTRPTIAEVMQWELSQLGVPSSKVHTQFSLGCRLQMPPRDTMEEVDLLPTLLRAVRLDPKEVEFDALGVWYYVPRIKLLYRSRGAQCQRVLGSWRLPTWLCWKHIAQQPLAYWVMCRDLEGKGKIVQKNRMKRSLHKVYRSDAILNLPSSWNNNGQP